MKISSEEAIKNWPGQNNPIEKRKEMLNPAAHGFNKASRKSDERTWGGKNANR